MTSEPAEVTAWRRPVRVIVYARENLFREGLLELLRHAPGLAVVGVVEDRHEGLRQAAALLPDVVLVYAAAPTQAVVQATAELARVDPHVHVLVLGTSHGEQAALDVLRAGAVGYVTKDVHADALADEIRRAAAGELAVGPETLRAAVAAATGNEPPPMIPNGLTRRQFEILRRMARGMSLKQIGRDLGVAEKTIRNQASQMYSRLKVRDHVEAILYALRIGLET